MTLIVFRNEHSHQETIAVLADGALIRQLTESEADVADGRVEDLDALAAAMREAPQV